MESRHGKLTVKPNVWAVWGILEMLLVFGMLSRERVKGAGTLRERLSARSRKEHLLGPESDANVQIQAVKLTMLAGFAALAP